MSENLAGYDILGHRCLAFITLNISCHSLLTCIAFAEKSADDFMGIPLHVICCLSLIAFITFSSVFNFCQFDYYVSWCISPWIYPAWTPLCFLDLVDYFLSHVGEVFSSYLFKYFLGSLFTLFSFWDHNNVNPDAFDVVPEVC